MAGGRFVAFNGYPRSSVVRLNSDGAMDSTFDTSNGVDGTVLALLPLSDGKVLTGGPFADVDGCTRLGIARLNGDTRILSAGFNSGNFNASLQTDRAKNYFLEYKSSLLRSQLDCAAGH